jgi:hypothetical protein
MLKDKFIELIKRNHTDTESPVEIKNKQLHVFNLINRLVPDNSIIRASGHGEIWLSVRVDELCKVITVSDVIELSKCGVFYKEKFNSLCMFV